MADFRQHFLNQFDRHITTGIIEFGKKLSNTKADVFILMARKAACFTECLEELGLAKLQGHVTTDRVLDMNLEWLKGKNVVIIDDVIVSGTTIFETINTLKKAEVKNINVIVICVNKDWYKEDLLLNELDNSSYIAEPFMKLKNEECIKLCSDIVNALSIFPRPYSIDFPLYKNTRISEDIFDEVLINSNWDCDEITSSLQKNNSVVSLTITPREYFLEKLDNALGFPISQTALCKVRVYGKFQPKARTEYSRNRTYRKQPRNVYNLKVLPIVVLKPIRIVDVNKIFDSICEHFVKNADSLRNGFTSSQSKLRLIQHIAAHYLGHAWVEQISHLTNSKISLSQDDRALSFLYPPHLFSIVQLISEQSGPIFKNASYNPVEINLNNEIELKSKITDNNLVSINAKLTEPFIHLYHHKELKSRELVKRYGKQVFQNAEYKSILTRLKKGFPITYLHKITKDFNDKYDTDKIVSLFLDKSIDMGIVVPITGEQNEILFRAYRHGEDVIFGELEERLCSLMLQSFSMSSENKPIPHIWTEKLLVLLLKIGVHKKIFREFIYDNPPKEVTRIVSVKNYLFGQVLKEQILEPTKTDIDPVYLNEDQKSQWLSNILLDKKYLTKVGARGYYKVEEIDSVDINANAKLEAENIGDIFGTLYNNKTKPRLSSKDLVLLTSCLNPNDISASMAAEIFIFRNKWDRYKSFLTRAAVNENKYFEIIRSIRHNNTLWTAINSGQDKFIDFKTQKGHLLIQQIASDLSGNRIVARNWLQFWSANMEWDEASINSELKELIEKQAHWLFKANIYLRTFDLLFRKLNRLSGQEEITIKSKLEEVERLKKNLIKENHLLQELEKEQERNREEIEKVKTKIKDYNDEIEKHKGDVKDLRNGISNITEEVHQKLSEIQEFTISDSKHLVEFVSNVMKLLSENDIDKFKNEKLINYNIKKLDECNFQTKLILDKVDLIVSSFGKVEYSIEYPHAFFVDFYHDDELERKEIEGIIFNELMKFEKETFRFKDKPNPSIASFYLLPINKNGIERGVWILGKGSFAKTRLLKLITNVFEALKGVCGFKVFYFPNLPSNSIISIQAKNNNNVKFGFFYDRALKVINRISNAKRQTPELITITASKEATDEVVADVPRDTESYFEKYDAENLDIEIPTQEQIVLTKFNPKKMDKKIDIGIITIVAPEKVAIDNILQNLSSVSGKKTIRKYSKGFLEGDHGYNHSVIMTQQISQGNESVVAAYKDLVEEFNPKLMVLFGIAGSIHEKNALCDVCIATQVIDYDKRKEGKNGKLEERGTVYRTNAKLLVFINEFFNIHGEFPRFDACENSLGKTFGVQAGPLGSGNAVVGNPASKIKAWLVGFNNKTLAVETEATGFSNTFYEEDLKVFNDKLGALIIRGISDHADYQKDDKWRVMAANNAAIVLKEFVKLLPNLDDLLKK
jgi:nucleoside phosphorylase/rRNA maturation endonuclease Nob1